MTSFSAFDILSLQKIGCTSTIQVNLIVEVCTIFAASKPTRDISKQTRGDSTIIRFFSKPKSIFSKPILP